MEKKTPLKLKYIKTLSSILRLSGAWPSHLFGEKLPLPLRVQRATLPFHASIIIIAGIYYLYENFHRLSFLDLGHGFITTFISSVTVFRSVLSLTKKYDSLLIKFHLEFHLMHYKHKGEYFEKMNKKVDKISDYYTKATIIIMYLGMIMFNMAPTYNNLRNKVFLKTENYSLEYSVYFSFPGFNPHNYFVSTSIYNYFVSYNVTTLICGIDLLLFLMIFQTLGHVFILRHNLKNVKSPKKNVIFKLLSDKISNEESYCVFEMFDVEENEQVRIKLAECIEHHKLIIGFTDDLSELFGPMLAVSYLFHLIACCVLLLESTEGGPDAVLRYGPLTLIIFGQLIQMSVMFEFMGSVTEKIRDSVYYMPWECMSVSNQRTICIMLHKMQYNISVKALGLAAVGVNTMMGILKTTITYYAFLRQKG